MRVSAVIPISPSRRGVRQILAGNVAQRFKHPLARGPVKRTIFGVIEQLGYGRTPLQIVGIERGLIEAVQSLIELDIASPALNAFRDFLVRTAVVVDGAFQQQYCLTLRHHFVQFSDFVLR